MTSSITVLFAGGGTGGHIYPNVAIAERVRERNPDVVPRFFVSNRPGDAQILSRLGHPFTASKVRPLPPLSRPWRVLPFLMAWYRSVADATALLRDSNIAAVVATGGFVSGPAVVAATRMRLPVALVNLDAIPGKANRRLVRYEPAVFSVYRTPDLDGAEIIGLPLRHASVGSGSAAAARAELALDPETPLLFVTGATHGAESIIRAMMALADAAGQPGPHQGLFDGWQVFHQCGTFDVATLQHAYDRAGVKATVVAYCDRMGAAWRAADLAVSRAGAGSVAEAWANATPTIFLPNPYHHDEHQRHNAQPVVDAGGAVMLADRIDPRANLDELGATLGRLMRDASELGAMRAALEASRPADGAAALADWVCAQLA